MKITLVRHGQPEFDLHDLVKNRYVPSELKRLVTQYSLSGLNAQHQPPLDLLEHAGQCCRAVCSDMRRSIESAHLLGVKDKCHVEPLFRESDLPHAEWNFPRLSLYSWFMIFRALWFLGYAKNGEPISQVKQRLAEAASYLIKVAEQQESVILVGHGFVNHFIARNLLAAGWSGPKRPGHDYWSYSVYELDNV